MSRHARKWTKARKFSDSVHQTRILPGKHHPVWNAPRQSAPEEIRDAVQLHNELDGQLSIGEGR